MLGKIDFAEFGTDKDRPFFMGLHLIFSMQGCGVGNGMNGLVNISKHCKWDSQKERHLHITQMVDNIADVLDQAKVNYVSELKGIPVEITIENNTFKSFRILTEVL